MSIDPQILERIEKLAGKYQAMGQDMKSYLDGLLFADYLTYWDYVHLETLLSLQTPRTPFPDEEIFIIYHQITELYFKLIKHALSQIADAEELTASFFQKQLERANSYYEQLISSFSVMIEGMDREQFLKFRMSLLPASGFQSVQAREIEIYSTNIKHLVHHSVRNQLQGSDDELELYEHLYWKKGATELATGRKTLTLRQFEKKYSRQLIRLIRQFWNKNLLIRFNQLSKGEDLASLKETMRAYDVSANIRWPLSHYKSAVKHLHKDSKDIAATGGTNWQKYLPPKNQMVMFFPELWTEEEKENWGRQLFQ